MIRSSRVDVAVVGAGPGGYIAAIRAAQLGLSTAVLERDELGGVCVNWGCIPTKALLHASDLRREVSSNPGLGLQVDAPDAALRTMVERSRAAAGRLSAGVRYLMRKNGVRVIPGVARLEGAGHVVVEKDGAVLEEVAASSVILATGASARSLPGVEAAGTRLWTAREAMVSVEVPTTLLVIGSGAIGIEFASFFSALGSKVTLVEILPRILPTADHEISALLAEELGQQGIEILTDARVEHLVNTGTALAVTVATPAGPRQIIADRTLVAVGVTGNIDGLGLETTAVRVDRGFIRVNEWLETDEPGIFAIGDVIGPPCLAHKASHEGILCAERIARVPGLHPLRRERIPACVYGSPQVACIGLTEADAIAAGRRVRIGRFPLRANGKAVATGETAGLAKTVFDAGSGELLGAHLVGAGVTEMIQGFAIAIAMEATERELIDVVFPHPTLSEAMHEAVLDAYGRALNI